MVKIMVLIALLSISCSPAPEGTHPGECSDGRDNDSDGKTDCDDDGCRKNDYCMEKVRHAEAEAARLKAQSEQKADSEKEALGTAFPVDELMVQISTNGVDVNWSGAASYCNALVLAGKTGWRLPTQEEAVKIFMSGKLTNQPSKVMWTSTKKGKNQAFVLGMSSGAINELSINDKGDCRARCVLGPVP